MRMWILLGLVLGLSACGYDRPPRDFRPANRDCPPLLGHWMVTDADVAKIAPQRVPPGKSFPFLSIERDERGTVELVLRRRPADVFAEAATLRLTHPQDYRIWRAATLGRPRAPDLAYYTPSQPGPPVETRWQMTLDECDGGWRRGGQGLDVDARPGSADAHHLAFVGLARGKNGELLIEHHVRRENISDFVFFGQAIRYYTYAYSSWHRLQPVPPTAIPASLTAADLPPDAPSPRDRMVAEYGRDRAWAGFSAWLRNQLPPDVTITILRRRLMDPVAMALPPDQVRVELAGHWTIGAPDPFMPLLESHPQVQAIEVKQARLQANNRPYRLFEFTITAEPAPR